MKVTVSQTRLQNTQAVEKKKPKPQIKLRKLKTKQTLTPFSIGATVRLKLAPGQDWRG